VSLVEMYVSELIADLVRLRDEHGDLPVAVHDDTNGRVLYPTAVRVDTEPDPRLPEIWISVQE